MMVATEAQEAFQAVVAVEEQFLIMELELAVLEPEAK